MRVTREKNLLGMVTVDDSLKTQLANGCLLEEVRQRLASPMEERVHIGNITKPEWVRLSLSARKPGMGNHSACRSRIEFPRQKLVEGRKLDCLKQSI